MTQEQKDLLLKDLCARLPYKVKVQDTYYNSLEPATIWLLDLNAQKVRLFADEGYQSIEYIKPYLFPLSSMNEEQYNEFFTYFHDVEMKEIETSGDYLKAAYLGEDAKRDWLNRNHFDYRYLIEKGLAKDATGLNIY